MSESIMSSDTVSPMKPAFNIKGYDHMIYQGDED